MTGGEILQLFAGVAVGIIIWGRIAEWRMIANLAHLRATSPAAATPLSAETPVAWWRLNRLLRAGAIVEAEKGRYYLDRDAYARFREERRKRGIMLLVLILLAVIMLGRLLPR